MNKESLRTLTTRIPLEVNFGTRGDYHEGGKIRGKLLDLTLIRISLEVESKTIQLRVDSS